MARWLLKGIVGSVMLAALCGCSIIPSSGPRSEDIVAQGTASGPDYGLIPLNPATIAILHKYEPKGLIGAFTDRRPPSSIVFGIGDIVSITIFEAAAGGLFIPAEAGVRPGNYVTIPDQPIDNDGFITVPYAGQIRAAGRTALDIQRGIIERIGNRAIEPQAVVAMASQRTSLISVLGEVNAPARYPASAAGAEDRILDAITRAGGIRAQGFETWVMLERKGKRATVPFENLVNSPDNNIFVRPGDRIYVYREPQKFLAFGASGQSGEFNFDAWRINFAEAVGKAGGLLDSQADPGAVFLYRREPREVAAQLGIDVARYNTETIPVIFSINLRDPGGFFLATKVVMRNQDIIYVSNAKSVDATKFLQFLRVIMATGGDAVALSNSALIFRNNLKIAP